MQFEGVGTTRMIERRQRRQSSILFLPLCSYKLFNSFSQMKYNSTLVQYILTVIAFTTNNIYKIYVCNKIFHIMKNTTLTSKHIVINYLDYQVDDDINVASMFSFLVNVMII